MIGRAAFNIRVPFWRGTNLDEVGVREGDGGPAVGGEADSGRSAANGGRQEETI